MCPPHLNVFWILILLMFIPSLRGRQYQAISQMRKPRHRGVREACPKPPHIWNGGAELWPWGQVGFRAPQRTILLFFLLAGGGLPLKESMRTEGFHTSSITFILMSYSWKIIFLYIQSISSTWSSAWGRGWIVMDRLLALTLHGQALLLPLHGSSGLLSQGLVIFTVAHW